MNLNKDNMLVAIMWRQFEVWRHYVARVTRFIVFLIVQVWNHDLIDHVMKVCSLEVCQYSLVMCMEMMESAMKWKSIASNDIT